MIDDKTIMDMVAHLPSDHYVHVYVEVKSNNYWDRNEENNVNNKNSDNSDNEDPDYEESRFEESDNELEDYEDFFEHEVDLGLDGGATILIGGYPTSNIPENEGLNSDNSHELHSLYESDDDGTSKRRYPEFNESVDMEKLKLVVGRLFKDRELLKQAIKQEARMNRVEVKFEKNDKKRVKAICKEENCPWEMWASLADFAIDPNDCMYPLAFAIVESKLKDSWSWFLDQLNDDFDIVNTHGWGFMSNKQKGLVPALEKKFPNSEHRFCVRHLYNNFKTNHKGTTLKEILWKAARSTYEQEFKQAMFEMRCRSPNVADWRTFTCRKWDLSGIPCMHAVAAILYNNENVYDHVPPCYKVETFINLYSNFITPIRGAPQWEKGDMPPVQPPVIRRAAGRPKKARRKVVDEKEKQPGKMGRKGVKMRCTLCGNIGHNKRSCRPQPKDQRNLNVKKAPVINETLVPNLSDQNNSQSQVTTRWFANGSSQIVYTSPNATPVIVNHSPTQAYAISFEAASNLFHSYASCQPSADASSQAMSTISQWAEVLSADAFLAFEAAGLDYSKAVTETGWEFQETILARGGGKAPLEVFIEFRGHEPSPEALLRHNGLLPVTASA
ncbi:hypothetical protein SLEP1_g51664 [Rubroshorea leprosula]|uniref:SWIM-type domain-containing protein n=1 Tax=Rubroshorea leprosula TaxID=152421 RepID=A0AAV5M3V2_9ROSI|nr:hypothetical protein SLEP1_g51664 [Rubroshorea leprosula]